MSRHIVHQMQPCPVSCVSTCLAMVAGLPASGVINRFHDEYRAGGLSLRQMLDELGVPFKSFDSADEAFLGWEGAYICTAPSLNIQAGTHQIIIEVTADDYWVVDPVMGRPEKLYYVKRGAAELPEQVELGGYSLDAFISAEWLASR